MSSGRGKLRPRRETGRREEGELRAVCPGGVSSRDAELCARWPVPITPDTPQTCARRAETRPIGSDRDHPTPITQPTPTPTQFQIWPCSQLPEKITGVTVARTGTPNSRKSSTQALLVG
jgi:hypothetical protein